MFSRNDRLKIIKMYQFLFKEFVKYYNYKDLNDDFNKYVLEGGIYTRLMKKYTRSGTKNADY